MSWSAPEYLYMVLLLNQTNLPAEALFLVRYQKVGPATMQNTLLFMDSPLCRIVLPYDKEHLDSQSAEHVLELNVKIVMQSGSVILCLSRRDAY